MITSRLRLATAITGLWAAHPLFLQAQYTSLGGVFSAIQLCKYE
jgi:hypothetical protein